MEQADSQAPLARGGSHAIRPRRRPALAVGMLAAARPGRCTRCSLLQPAGTVRSRSPRPPTRPSDPARCRPASIPSASRSSSSSPISSLQAATCRSSRTSTGLRDQVYKELQLPPANPRPGLPVRGPRALRALHDSASTPTCRSGGPSSWPSRAASAAREDLLVYTYWGDRIQQDLRHELTHALLHSVLKDVPLWLDEGLAEYFELPPASWKGVNHRPPASSCGAADVQAQPGPAGAAQPGAADDAGRVPRGLGLGPPDAARQRREAKTVLLAYLAAAAHQSRTRPARPAAGDGLPGPGGGAEPAPGSARSTPGRPVAVSLNTRDPRPVGWHRSRIR